MRDAVGHDATLRLLLQPVVAYPGRRRHGLGRAPATLARPVALAWDGGRVARGAGILADARARYDSELVAYLDDADEEE